MTSQSLNEMIDDILGTPGWAAPDFVTDGMPINVSGSNVILNLQTLSSGDPAPSYVVPLGK